MNYVNLTLTVEMWVRKKVEILLKLWREEE